jgi:hypothetical protein
VLVDLLTDVDISSLRGDEANGVLINFLSDGHIATGNDLGLRMLVNLLADSHIPSSEQTNVTVVIDLLIDDNGAIATFERSSGMVSDVVDVKIAVYDLIGHDAPLSS